MSWRATIMLQKFLREWLSFLLPRMGGLLLALTLLAGRGISGTAPAQTVKNRDWACAACHREIYDRYLKTPMARASGPAIDGMLSIPADFVHQKSGVRYRIVSRDGQVYMTYERTGKTPDASLKGEERLLYFVGLRDSRTHFSLSARGLLV